MAQARVNKTVMLGRMVQMSQERSKVLEGLEKRDITHPGGFSQRKWHLSKSLKEG